MTMDERSGDMKVWKAAFWKRMIPAVLAVLLLTSCHGGRPAGGVLLSFKGEDGTFYESDEYVYMVSHANSGNDRNSTYYISSFTKTGEKNWEITPGFGGRLYPLKDGRFFYAAGDGEISAYDQHGKEIWKKYLDVEEFKNSNYLLNQNEDLMINIRSSPSDSTVYQTVSFSGKVTTSAVIPGLATCFTYKYPLGGYITEGYAEPDNWYICRLNDDLSVVWRVRGGNVEDFSQDGRILCCDGGSSLRELDPEGQEINRIEFDTTLYTKARYFQDKIVVAADKLRILEPDFTIAAAFDEVRFSRMKAFEASFFVYSPGSYARDAAVTYDGYCKELNGSDAMASDRAFKKSDRFIEIGDTGRFYYRK